MTMSNREDHGGAAPMTPQDRLRELATQAAHDNHDEHRASALSFAHDRHAYDDCSHPDCVLVREAPARVPATPSDDRTTRAIIDRLHAGEPWREVVADYAPVPAAPPPQQEKHDDDDSARVDSLPERPDGDLPRPPAR